MNSLFYIFSHFSRARALDILFQIARAEECREDTMSRVPLHSAMDYFS